MRLRIFSAASALALAAALLAPSPAEACSMCRCSDPVFSALGEGRCLSGSADLGVRSVLNRKGEAT